ncbi:type IV conjugative transfer system coupling protein TraD [Pantoea cypripedii]|uniref:Type IV conjugative transfer system coupling protein TraD n=1 Tax=Pantoea cypripedii TaxID=55209 RepID=A0A1X1EMB5_PANCY|nr:type IV conjugative transfer system coupling protein TraD [Pantoea cypripedii]MBP2200601.1 type IV conjugative transfer system coupling protein TraD [Pantoea cypripedii]ORM90097.1 type IV conjugative transfer system coupling protein TraD [Pantoea cypripedii]
MSFTPKNLTQGGQMTAYRLRMFGQVSNWIFHWILLLFIAAVALLFWLTTPDDVLRNGFWYWAAWPSHSLLGLAPGTTTATWDILWHCGDGTSVCTTKMTPVQLLADPWMQAMGDAFVASLKFLATVCGITAFALWCLIAWFVGRIGKKESEDEFISGMTLTDQPKEVNRLLKKAGEKSDLQIGGLHMVKNAEVMNFLIHGTIGVGKSTLIRWLLDYIRRRGDRAIIYDSGGTFIETHYNPRRDKILNPHDSRCENWVLWRECREVVDYENLTAALMPVEGDSDPFWVSSSRTIFSDGAMQFAADPARSIETFLKTLLSIDLKSLREFLKNTPSANLVEEKIEKTAISIRSVLTNYAKSLRYLQGLDKEGKPEFSIREWMTSPQYDSSWLFISTTARHRRAVRPLISMWLSLATLLLQSMGENSERRVWFVGDEIASLQKIPELNETLAEARKFGGCFVLGVQNIPQLVHIYGREMAKAIFDLLNTRAYGRSPSAEVAKMVEEELGHQRRREAREQNSYGLDQVRDGISISKDKVNDPVVDYDLIMKMPNLRFYVRLPGEYPVVKLSLKYRKQKKSHRALIERDFRDRLSPELEAIITGNERATTAAHIRFPTGEEILEGSHSQAAENKTSAVSRSEKPSSHSRTDKPAGAPLTPASLSAAGKPVMAASPAAEDRAVTVSPESPGGPVIHADNDAGGSSATVLPANVRRLTPRLPPARTPAVATPVPAAGMPALDRIRRLQDRNSTGGSEEDSSTPAGETPELHMLADKDEAGQLTVRTAGYRKTDPESREEAYAAQYGRANQQMADEELNILRHREDDETYQAMSQHHEPGGHER